jgi:nicotinate phosphoribosyltransferase
LKRDVVALEGDVQEGEPLLKPILRGGRRLDPGTSLQDIRERTKAGLTRLPGALRRLECASDYPVEIAPSVQELARVFDEENEYAHHYEHK